MGMTERLQVYRKEYEALIEDPPDFDELREELRGYKVDLVADVTESGVLAINKVIAEVNAYKDRVFGMISGLQGHKDLWDELRADANYVYRDSFDRALLQEHVIKLRSKDLREAKARLRTAPAQELLNDIDRGRKRVQDLLSYARDVLQRLDDANKSVSRQITVIQTAYDLEELQRGDTPRAVVVGKRGSRHDA